MEQTAILKKTMRPSSDEGAFGDPLAITRTMQFMHGDMELFFVFFLKDKQSLVGADCHAPKVMVTSGHCIPQCAVDAGKLQRWDFLGYWTQWKRGSNTQRWTRSKTTAYSCNTLCHLCWLIKKKKSSNADREIFCIIFIPKNINIFFTFFPTSS